MKILFIISHLGAANWQMYYSEGIASISASLKQNQIETDIFLVKSPKDFQILRLYIQDTHPDFIGISVTDPQYLGAVKISRYLKKYFPKIFIVFGGIFCILNPNTVIKNQSVDAVCLGEGENALVNLIKLFESKTKYWLSDNFYIKHLGKTYKNKFLEPVDLNLLPYPDRELFHRKDLDGYYGNIWQIKDKKGGEFLMSRGCIFNCNYCSSPVLNKKYGQKYYRLINPKLGIDQLKAAISEFHYDYITFVDDTFTINPKWVKKFLTLYQKHIKIPFNIQTRVGTFTKDTIRLLKKANCYLVMIGVESGDESIRKTILNRQITNQQITTAAKWIKDSKTIMLATYNMMGLPGETPQKFKSTILLNAAIQADRSYIFIFFPYHNTELYRLCDQQGLIDKNIKNIVEREDSKLKLPDFTLKDILYYYNHFNYLIENCHHPVLFKLLFTPPSSFFFPFTQFFYNLLKSNHEPTHHL